ncbi:thiamine-phosphate kinase [Corynebacterium tapiri]|uniref:Thiamine-monophosphate kinase n=1 Tax=Corynebacterium tapiri TaxID=1448266 RepID=A0A5C4U5Y9_9CORY|nr:thiamine-phosphate kinase [Corynebacterium tapiri]TNL99816.1 thiamine-phosphate kinase [Corynebacterium tapiri]
MADPQSALTVGDVGEHAVIQAIIEAAPSVLNGDDAAVLTHASPNSRSVVATDMLVSNRHFSFDYSTPFEVGYKAITVNFADIEAMGARPVGAVLALALPPDTPLDTVRELAQGVDKRCREYTTELLGGDVTASDQLVVSITAVGSLGGNRDALRLDRARVGQRVVAHGAIGYSAAGFALLEKFGRKRVPQELDELVRAHCQPALTPGRGVVARATGATAATDNSDGLVPDLDLLARRSHVGINLDADALQPDDLLQRAGELCGVDPWEWVLTGGEDHTLIATTASEAPSKFRTIGEVIRGEGVTVDGQAPEYQKGWVSF